MSITLNIAINLSPTEEVQLKALMARFGLQEEQVVAILVQHGMSLTQGPIESTISSLENLLDQRVAGYQAVMDELRALTGKIGRAVTSTEVVNGLLTARVSALPTGELTGNKGDSP